MVLRMDRFELKTKMLSCTVCTKCTGVPEDIKELEILIAKDIISVVMSWCTVSLI